MASGVFDSNSNIIPIAYNKKAKRLLVGESPGQVHRCVDLIGFFEILKRNYGFSSEARSRFCAFWEEGMSPMRIYRWLRKGLFQIERIGRSKNQERKYYLVETSPLCEGGGLNRCYRGFSRKGTARAVTKLRDPQGLDNRLKRSIKNAAVMSKLKGDEAVGIEYVSRLINHQKDVRVAELGKCNLRDFVLKFEGLYAPGERVTAYQQIFQALEFMHRNQLVHDDIKSRNIVVRLNSNGTFDRIQVIDFDFLTKCSNLAGFMGTGAYVAPEKVGSSHILLSDEEITKRDVWSAMYTMGDIELKLHSRGVQSLLSPKFFDAFRTYSQVAQAGGYLAQFITRRYEFLQGKENLFEDHVLVSPPILSEPNVGESSQVTSQPTSVKTVQHFVPQTWMDWVFYVSAYVNPQQRWSSEKVMKLFELGSWFENDLELFCLACQITKEDIRLIFDVAVAERGCFIHLRNAQERPITILVGRQLASDSSGEEAQEVTNGEGESSSSSSSDS